LSVKNSNFWILAEYPIRAAPSVETSENAISIETRCLIGSKPKILIKMEKFHGSVKKRDSGNLVSPSVVGFSSAEDFSSFFDFF